MIRKINAFFTRKAITVRGAKNYPTAHDLERSQLTQLFTQLLSHGGYPTSSPKQSGFFFLKISKEIGKAWCKRVLRARRACEASFFFIIIIFSDLLFDCSRGLNTQKYGLFCRLAQKGEFARRLLSENENDTTVYDA